jgi:PAS domain S-box-containing protein
MAASDEETFEPLFSFLMREPSSPGGAEENFLHPELAGDVAEFEELLATMTTSFAVGGTPPPPASLRRRLLGVVETRPPSVVTTAFGLSPEELASEALVVSGLDKFVQWVSPAFCSMCGYAPDELRGRRLGPLLQGPLTDPHAVEVVRQAIRRYEPVTQELINYHKDGSPYWVHLSIRASFGPDGKPLAYVAIERKIEDRDVA